MSFIWYIGSSSERNPGIGITCLVLVSRVRHTHIQELQRGLLLDARHAEACLRVIELDRRRDDVRARATLDGEDSTHGRSQAGGVEEKACM